MEQNLFEEIKAKKNAIISRANKACEYGWITAERKQEIIDKLETDVLTIGVIGQMKCGKSTFLNSFVFEDDILPAADTPMTAALSVITYGEEKKIVAEFYTEEEWEEQKLNASRSLEDTVGNPLEEAKIKAAKELVEKATRLRGTDKNLLGKSQTDVFKNLIEYVGADGKYVSITKSVKIYYPKDYLKGVEIVDTPGFNDPIVSREERTKQFLNKADVVLMMLYAGRPFDATDSTILTQNVRQCGMGKVLIAINKYDIPYMNGDSEEEIKTYVKQQIEKACKATDDDSLKDLLKETSPIPISAEMALLAELPMSKITASKNYDFDIKRYYDTFEISSQAQLKEKSHINELVAAIKEVIDREKGEILFQKPINAIMAAGNKKKDEICKELREKQDMLKNLSLPDEELEVKLDGIQRANKRLTKKINGCGDNLDEAFDDIIRKGNCELEDLVDEACDKMNRIIEDHGTFSGQKSLAYKLNSEYEKLKSRTLKRAVNNIEDSAKRKIKEVCSDFFIEVGDILKRYMPDFDEDSFISGIKKNIAFEIDDCQLFNSDNGQSDNGQSEDDFGNSDGLDEIIENWFTVLVVDAATMRGFKGEWREIVQNIRSGFDAKKYLSRIKNNKNSIIGKVRTMFIDELVEPLEAQLNEVKDKKEDKEKMKVDTQKAIDSLNIAKQKIEEQLVSFA